MNKITCDICCDLIPLVNDGIASEDSKQAVLAHVSDCASCKALLAEQLTADIDMERVIGKVQKRLRLILLLLIALGVVFGISIAPGEFMFYNVLIMPIIGAVSYVVLKNHYYVSILLVFISVYFRFLYDSIGYAFMGQFANAFVAPLWWALIYTGFVAVGALIALLVHFGFRKE